jgi:hypothetical protein
VVELHVYEGETWEMALRQDITFKYEANFFLYTTLSHARPMANGRVQTPAATTPPILSGMPVSGMAYLDRPQEAGYFLFPDLSVRHEGRYNLDFALYEQMKDEGDKDANEPAEDDSYSPCGDFYYRMTIKSNDFSVFSAKKFPGLAQSTTLSRTVAEQGCRVRIRRDVRMRRREGKAGAEYDDAEDGGYARRRRTQTPETAARARSMSNHSAERTPYGTDPHRRPSHASDYPTPTSGGPHSAGYMPYNAQHNPQYPQYAPPPPPPPPPAPIKQSPSVPVSPSYTGYPTPMTGYPPPPLPAHHHYRERTASQEFRQMPVAPEHRNSLDMDYRRQSLESQPYPASRPSSFTSVTSDRLPSMSSAGMPSAGMVRNARPHSGSIDSDSRLCTAPLAPPPPAARPPTQPTPAKQPHSMKITDIMHSTHHQITASMKPDMVQEIRPAVAPPRGQKRPHDERDPGPIKDGERQPDHLPEFSNRLWYTRANGQQMHAVLQEET